MSFSPETALPVNIQITSDKSRSLREKPALVTLALPCHLCGLILCLPC